MQVKICGIRKGTTKTGKVFCNYYGVKDFSAYDAENNECQGHEATSAFSYKDYGLQPGDLVDFQYEPSGFDGKAVLGNIVVLEREADKASSTAATTGKK